MSYETLYKAIKRHSGMDKEQIIEAGEHGADAGWPGFTYYTDTVKFYDKYHDQIWELAIEEAGEFGNKNVFEMCAGFKVADSVDDVDSMKNLMAWYALEEVGRWLENA